MQIVKVDAIQSTNTFLKEMCQEQEVGNFTIVITNKQTKGRGQMHTIWESEQDKNLTFSVLIRFDDLCIENQFYISKVISLAIYDVLQSVITTKISIKWPNDIMAEHKKVCGVLIENSVKKSRIKYAVVGIGLNVNQLQFKNLPNATSLQLLSGYFFDLDKLLLQIVASIKEKVKLIDSKNWELIDNKYLKNLYKNQIPAMFKDTTNNFMGKIVGVSKIGKLLVEQENNSIKEYDLKEISFLNK